MSNAVLGMYQGTVSNNADPLAEARVTMLIPQLLGNAESAWAIPASPTNTVPPVGQVLWVQFSGGDITKPVYSPLGIKDVQDQVSGLGLVTKEPPKQPTAFTLTTTPYTSPEGVTLARVQASWTPPTENQDGTPLTDMSHYLLQWSYDGSTWVGGTTTEDSIATFDGLHTGVNVTVRIQAIDTSGNASLWASASILTASSSTPPAVPSTPVVLAALAGLRVHWDGLDSTGAAMAPFFDHVVVQRDTTNAFAAPVTVATFTGADYFYDSVQNYASAYFYRFVAYSKTGFASAASASASGTALQAANADIVNGAISEVKIQTGGLDASQVLKTGTITAASGIIGSIDASKITVGQITGGQIAAATITGNNIVAGTISADKLLIGSGRNLMADGSFEGPVGAAIVAAAGAPWVLDTVKGGNGSATSVGINATAGSTTTWSVEVLTGLRVLPGDQLFLSTDWACTSLTGNSLRMFVEWKDSHGTILSYGTTIITTNTDGSWRTATGNYTAPAQAASCDVWLQVFQATAVVAWFDNVVVAPVLPTTSIQDGSISTSKIQTGSITAASGIIASIDAGTITTGTLDASRITVTNLNAQSIIAGTLTLDKLSVGLQSSVVQKFYDFGLDAAKWVMAGSGGTMTTVTATDAQSGGSVMQCAGYINGAYRPDIKIPFDPSQTYRVTARFRQTVANSPSGTSQDIFVGVMGWAADGVTPVNKDGANSFSSQHYVVANGEWLTTGGGWVTWTGYIRGTASTGTRQECPNAGTPGQVHSSVRYISPFMYLNYQNGNGTCQMDMFTIEVVNPGQVKTGHMAPGTITTNLVPNPGFEQTGHWFGNVTGNGTAVQTQGTNARTGAWYYALGAPTATDGAYIVSDIFPVTPGQTYTLGVWASGTGVCIARIKTSSDANTWTETTDQIESIAVSQTPGTYTWLSASKTIPAGATWAEVVVYNWQPSTPGTMLVDDISVTAGAVTNPAGTGSLDLSGNGLHVYDQFGNLTASLSGGDDDFIQFGGGAGTLASDGSVSATEVDVDNDVYIQGVPMLTDPTYGSFLNRAPGALNAIYANNVLDMLPRGIVAYANINQIYYIGQTETGVLELDAQLEPYRSYRIMVGGSRIIGQSSSSGNQGTFALQVRSTGIGGAAPTTTSPAMNSAWAFVPPYQGNWYETTYVDYITTGSTSGLQRMLLTCQVRNGTTGQIVSWGAQGWFVVEDLGPAIPETGVWIGSPGSSSSAGGSAGGTQSTKKTYTTTWNFDWSGSYDGSGNYNSYFGNGMNQGYYSSNNGNQAAMMGFSSTNLSSIASALSGATINSCNVYLYANHWYYNSGGTAVIGTHGVANTRPSTFSGTQNRLQVSSWANPAGKTVSLGTTIGGEFKSGTTKGIILGHGPSTSYTYYGNFNGAGQSYKPYLTISYTK